MPRSPVQLTRGQVVEISIAWAVLLYRAFAAGPAALPFDWLALGAAYWIYAVFGQGSRSWAPVTALVMVWMAVLPLRAHGWPA